MEKQIIAEEELNLGFDINDIMKEVQNNTSNFTENSQYNRIDPTQTDTPKITEQPDPFGENVVTEEVEETTEPQENVEAQDDVVEEVIVEDIEYDTKVNSAAMRILESEGFLQLPEDMKEDLSDEEMQEIFEQNERRRDEETLNRIRSKAGDPKIVELLDFVMEGGSWYGFDEMKNTLQDEIDISGLDETNEDHQRHLISMYLSDGLDPNNPSHARRLKGIEAEVNNSFERFENDELSKEAKNYLLSKVEDKKNFVIEQQQEAKRLEDVRKQNEINARNEWNNKFKDSLNSRKWNENKKNEVINQFDIVELTNGEKMEMWKYKYDAIWKDPESTQVLMDFLSEFDHNTLKFKNKDTDISKAATSKIKQLIKNKVSKKGNSQYNSNNRGSNIAPILV